MYMKHVLGKTHKIFNSREIMPLKFQSLIQKRHILNDNAEVRI
jgi:hypothetical protein